jgi:hypothetical protein
MLDEVVTFYRKVLQSRIILKLYVLRYFLISTSFFIVRSPVNNHKSTLNRQNTVIKTGNDI